MSGAENGAERAENRVEQSEAVNAQPALQKKIAQEQSVEREVVERERSGDYRNGIKRGVAILVLTLRSHALQG